MQNQNHLYDCYTDQATKISHCYSDINASPFYIPNFSSGDLMISLLLFIFLIIELIKLVARSISKIKINKKYLGNNSQDGKNIYNI